MTEINFKQNEGLVFDIQRWSIHDGPGVRTVVFLKGCPMRCVWCCNPESHQTYNELVFFKDKCIDCKRCISYCPHEAIKTVMDKRVIDREICSKTCFNEGLNVFPCSKQCYGKALAPVAEIKTADQVMNEVMKDELIYKKSKVGGLTLSGGDPAMQYGFSFVLLERAKSLGITTAMETCGVASWNIYEKLLEQLDYLFFDIKIWDPENHKKYTGQNIETVLENAVKASGFLHNKGKSFTVRIPVIPTISDIDDFKLILDFAKKELSPGTSVEIMPYHRLGRGKYINMGMNYSLKDLKPFNEDELTVYKELLSSYNFREQV